MAFNKDMVTLAKANSFFQKEVYLDKNIQIVLMSLKPGEDIGEETHRADQTTYFVDGTGSAVLDGRSTKVAANHMIVIPQGTKHNIINKGTTPSSSSRFMLRRPKIRGSNTGPRPRTRRPRKASSPRQ